MILVTVGTDMPFDRMVRVVDDWAGQQRRSDVFAQIGNTKWRPAHIPFSQFIEPDRFADLLRQATAIVAHAGMGTILSALSAGKPIIVMPRRASLGEQRNEHQLATANRLLQLGKVEVAFDEPELQKRLVALDRLGSKPRIGPCASEELVTSIQQFIHGTSRPLAN